MIDVKTTISSTLKTAFDRMRLLGDNDTKLFRKIMYLIVLDDIYDWSDYLDEKQSVQKRLQELRTNFIMCNPEFDVCRFPFDQHYVNVNTPQTNYTWKRVWDAPDLTEIETKIDPQPGEVHPWKPDPTCPISVVYFEGEGAPDIDVSTLTTCEKMNIYINREEGTIWYLDELCVWKKVEVDLNSWTEDEILDTVTNKLNIHHFQNENESDINAILSRTENDPIEFCNTEELVEDLV